MKTFDVKVKGSLFSATQSEMVRSISSHSSKTKINSKVFNIAIL